MSLTLLHSPHASQVLAGVAVSPRRFNRLTTLKAKDGGLLVVTWHDLFVVEDVFDLVNLDTDDLREVHAYIVAEVIIPCANA